MRRRILWCGLVIALALGISGIAAACGGGEEGLSVEEYFQQLQTISDDLEERGAALDAEFEAAFASETEGEIDFDVVQRVLSDGAAAFKDALDGVEGLEPPSEVEDAHREFVEQLRARADLIQSVADQAAQAGSVPDLEEVFAQFQGPEVEEEAASFSAACEALEGLAADNGIEVSLNCE